MLVRLILIGIGDWGLGIGDWRLAIGDSTACPCKRHMAIGDGVSISEA
ncbi:hypothetical protein [Mastigocoleus sp. MO_188.B34]|nr:hypothetical protein [Mastigocoleus sp. MO_188.B34]MDJ0696562.1 hypothetical protein [Mastigocoleus sp. MO_188.B34]